MNNADSLWDMLFSTAQEFEDSDYLLFLAGRVPADLADQLERDSCPDLSLNKVVDVADLMRPLSTRDFPSEKLYEIADVLSFTLLCYRNVFERSDFDTFDRYKLIYAASLYLYCFIHGHGKPLDGSFIPALSMLATICEKADLPTRLHVICFLCSLLPLMRTQDIWEPAPVSSVLISVSLILGSLVNQLAELAGETMKREDIGQAWVEEDGEERPPSDDAIRILKRDILRMFGADGNLRQATAQFLLAIGGTTQPGGGGVDD